MNVVETNRLTKWYGRHEALRGIDLRVAAGGIVGFLGPNGAGKTTALRILLGLLRATAGRVTVFGRDPWRDGPAIREQVGYLPGDVRFYDHLTGRRIVDFADAVRGSRAQTEIRRLASVLELDLDRRVRDYSRGMKQKLGLIVALMHRPKLLILDEPTVSLDPLVRQILFEELRAVADDGRTVLFSSHTLGEVEELCDQVAILRNGRLIEQDRIDVLRRRALRRVEVVFDGDGPLRRPPKGLHVLRESDGRLSGTWVGGVAPLLSWLAENPVRDVTIAAPDLEDLFLAYYTDEKPEDAA